MRFDLCLLLCHFLFVAEAFGGVYRQQQLQNQRQQLLNGYRLGDGGGGDEGSSSIDGGGQQHFVRGSRQRDIFGRVTKRFGSGGNTKMVRIMRQQATRFPHFLRQVDEDVPLALVDDGEDVERYVSQRHGAAAALQQQGPFPPFVIFNRSPVLDASAESQQQDSSNMSPDFDRRFPRSDLSPFRLKKSGDLSPFRLKK